MEGVRQMRSGLASIEKLRARAHRPHILTLLAEAVSKTGDYVQALQLIEEALAEGERSGERFYEAETWRIKGELLLMQASAKQKTQNAESEATGRLRTTGQNFHGMA